MNGLDTPCQRWNPPRKARSRNFLQADGVNPKIAPGDQDTPWRVWTHTTKRMHAALLARRPHSGSGRLAKGRLLDMVRPVWETAGPIS